MNLSGVQSGLVGMAIFDMYMDGMRKSHKKCRAQGSPLIAAVADAFEAYIHTQEVGHAAQIASVATYALNPGGGSVAAITPEQMAPFLALNIMA